MVLASGSIGLIDHHFNATATREHKSVVWIVEVAFLVAHGFRVGGIRLQRLLGFRVTGNATLVSEFSDVSTRIDVTIPAKKPWLSGWPKQTEFHHFGRCKNKTEIYVCYLPRVTQSMPMVSSLNEPSADWYPQVKLPSWFCTEYRSTIPMRFLLLLGCLVLTAANFRGNFWGVRTTGREVVVVVVGAKTGSNGSKLLGSLVWIGICSINVTGLWRARWPVGRMRWLLRFKVRGVSMAAAAKPVFFNNCRGLLPRLGEAVIWFWLGMRDWVGTNLVKSWNEGTVGMTKMLSSSSSSMNMGSIMGDCVAAKKEWFFG